MLWGDYNTNRTMLDFEHVMPKECTVDIVDLLFDHILREIHPERFEQPSPPPIPPRKRPSKEEALRVLPELLQQLFGVVDELEFLFQRPFTPDGHMVGSIGEAVAAFIYDLDLLCGSAECHDAKAKNGRKVQVKLTAKERFNLWRTRASYRFPTPRAEGVSWRSIMVRVHTHGTKLANPKRMDNVRSR